MSYRACFDCELIFEVDDVPGVESMTCPQCGGGLEVYVPEAEELSADEEPHIAATAAVEGLSEAVAQNLLSREVLAEPVETEPDPTDGFNEAEPTRAQAAADTPPPERKPLPEITHRKRPRFGQTPQNQGRATGGKTRVLQAVDNLVATGDQEALGIAPEAGVPEMAPTAMLEGALPPMPERGPDPMLPPRSNNTGEHAVVAPTAPLGGHMSAPVTLPPPSRRKSRWPLVVMALLVLGGGGAGAWWFMGQPGVSDGNDTPDAQPDSAPPAALSWTARIEKQVEDGQAGLAVVSGLPAVEEGGPFVAGGPEGVMTSEGPVTGMPTTRVRKDILDTDADGQWVRPLVHTLQRAKSDAKQRFSLALDAKMPAGDVVRLAYAAFKYGHRDFGLVVARADGGLGAVPFKVARDSDAALPFQLQIRIGRTRGFNVTVRQNNKVVSEEPRLIDRNASGKLDMRALGDRLTQLAQDHPGVPTVVIHPQPDMTLATLVQVIATVRGRGETPRFGELRLGVR